MRYPSSILWLNPSISIAKQIITYGQLLKPYLHVTLPEPNSMDRGPRTRVTEDVSQLALDFIEGGA